MGKKKKLYEAAAVPVLIDGFTPKFRREIIGMGQVLMSNLLESGELASLLLLSQFSQPTPAPRRTRKTTR